MNESVEQRLLEFIGATFLGGDTEGLDRDTPLVEWGILSSVRSLRLVAWLQQEFQATVPVSADALATVARIAAAVGGDAGSGSVQQGEGGHQVAPPLLS